MDTQAFVEWMDEQTRPEATDMNFESFMRKIADGKLLMRFSYMDFNVTCDCCGSEEKLKEQGQPDTLQHKYWCIVVAARRFFPEFVSGNYPEDLKNLRGYSAKENGLPRFSWL